MEKHYSESIYSKLYSALHCLTVLTDEKNISKEDSIKTNEARQRLKKLLPVLKFRISEIKATNSALGVLLEISEQSVPGKEVNTIEQRQLLPLDEFKAAWSYFIASVLTLIFYQENGKSAGLPQGFNAENYTKSILGFVDKQCSRGINHFHIVKLLWLIFDEKKDSGAVKFLVFCLQNQKNCQCLV